MSEVVRSGRARRRAFAVPLVAGVSAICLLLSVAPGAAAAPSRTSALQAAGALAAGPTADAVTGTTTGSTGRAGDPVTVTLLGSDPDSAPDQLTYAVAQPAPDTVTVVGDQLTYTPAKDVFGDVEFRYVVTDEQGATAEDTVTITVDHDPAPVAGSASATTRGATGRPGDPVTIEAAVSDAELGTIAYAVSDPMHGKATIGAPSTPGGPVTIIYTPGDGFFGSEVFTWTATDRHGEVGTGTITVSVTANSAPTAPALSASTRSSTSRTGIPVSIALSSVDGNGDPISYALGAVTGGAATLDQGGTTKKVVFTPATGFAGPASVAYTASDTYGGVTAGTISIAVTANTAPVASGVSATVKGATTRSGDIARLDLTAFDPDGPDRTLTYDLLDRPTPAQGVAGLSGAQLTFTPAAGYAGTLVLRYQATDSVGDVATANATIVVTENEAPTTPTVSKATQGSTTEPGDPVTFTLPASDPDGIVSVAAASTAKGTVALAGSALTYTPIAGRSGPDTFTYTATDGRGRTNTGTVTVNVLPNAAPVGTTSTASTVYGRPVVIPLTATDKQGDEVKFGSSQGPEHGSPSYGDTVVTYTPSPGFARFERQTDTFSYKMTDARGAVSYATITVTVNPNRAPVADAVAVETRGGAGTVAGRTVLVPLSGTDAEQDLPLTFGLDGQPKNGTAVLGQNGTSLAYTPRPGFVGTETITYRVTDRVLVAGVVRPDLQATSTATAYVVVTADSAPTADPVSLQTIGSDVGPGTPVTAALVSTDPEGDAVTFSLGSFDPAVGEATVSAGGAFSFTPFQGFSGLTFASYVATDAMGASTSGVVVINVRANRTPTAKVGTATTRGGTTTPGRAVDISMASMITDPDGDPLAVTGRASRGVVTVIGSGSATKLRYQPAPKVSGSDTISYQVSDGRGGTASSTITVSVSANRAPTVAAANKRIFNGRSTELTLAGSDPDRDAFTYRVTVPANRGSAHVVGTRLYYQAPQGFANVVRVSVEARDAYGAVGRSTVTFTMYAASSFTRVDRIGPAVSSAPPKFAVQVTAPPGSVAGGRVTVTAGGRTLATGLVAWNGTLTLTSRSKLAKGKHPVVFTYAGTPRSGTARTVRELTVS